MVPIKAILGKIVGLYWGCIGDNGKENGNYYNGLYGRLSKLCSLFGSLL